MTDEELRRKLAASMSEVEADVAALQESVQRLLRRLDALASAVPPAAEKPGAAPSRRKAPTTCERHGYGVLVVRYGPCPVCAREARDGHEHQAMSDHPKFKYFLDAKPYEVEHQFLTGGAIKRTAAPPIPDAYQLFLEEEDDRPDKPISDSENVDLAGRIKHLYAVPPATFGL